jgi:hypothetical protein
MSGFLTASALLLTYKPAELYNGLSASSLVLAGTLPLVPLRCAIILSTVIGHADVSGDVYINTEKISFSTASRKTSTTLLTSLPAITSANLDCQIQIIALNSGGVELQQETRTPIACDWSDATSWYQSVGVWARADSSCETDKLDIVIDDKVLYNGRTYTVKNIKDGETTLGGTVLTKVLQFA